MADKTTLTRYANWCAVSHRHDLVPDPQNGDWVLFTEAHTIELERDRLRQRNEELEARIASLTHIAHASELALQERNNLIIDLKIRIEGLQREADDCLYLKMGFMYGAICWCQEAYVIGQERDDLCAQKYLLQDRIAELETEVAEIRGSTSFGKHIAIEHERDALLAAIDSDDVNWLTALREVRRAITAPISATPPPARNTP